MSIILDNFNSQPARKGKRDVTEIPRVMNRLKKEIPKIKDVLSANKMTIVKIDEIDEYDGVKVVIIC
jgi:molecular chaperone DnaK (HSP70)